MPQLEPSMRVLTTQAWVPRRPDCEPPAAERFKPIPVQDHPTHKPRGGGFWTSSYDERYGSGWVQWCLSEEFECDRNDLTFPLWTLEPEPTARVYHIDTYADLEALIDRYPHRRDYPDRGYGAWLDLKPDWQRIADDFDAVHLTDEGQWATRLSHPLDLYGWDCESTFWLRWAFTDNIQNLGRVLCAAKDPWWEEATA